MIYKTPKYPAASEKPALEDINGQKIINEQKVRDYLDPNGDGIISPTEAKSAARKLLEISTRSRPDATADILGQICASPEKHIKQAIASFNGTINIPSLEDNSRTFSFKIPDAAIRTGVESLCEHYQPPEEEPASPPKSTPPMKPRTKMFGRK